MFFLKHCVIVDFHCTIDRFFIFSLSTAIDLNASTKFVLGQSRILIRWRYESKDIVNVELAAVVLRFNDFIDSNEWKISSFNPTEEIERCECSIFDRKDGFAIICFISARPCFRLLGRNNGFIFFLHFFLHTLLRRCCWTSLNIRTAVENDPVRCLRWQIVFAWCVSDCSDESDLIFVLLFGSITNRTDFLKLMRSCDAAKDVRWRVLTWCFIF